jgi:hypothetical protein
MREAHSRRHHHHICREYLRLLEYTVERSEPVSTREDVRRCRGAGNKDAVCSHRVRRLITAPLPRGKVRMHPRPRTTIELRNIATRTSLLRLRGASQSRPTLRLSVHVAAAMRVSQRRLRCHRLQKVAPRVWQWRYGKS